MECFVGYGHLATGYHRTVNQSKKPPGNLQLFVVQCEAQGDRGTAHEACENTPRARIGLQ